MGKYFKYAIGEIILVVIGILIALQVNNWNEIRKLTNTQKNYISELSADIDSMNVQYKILVDFNTKRGASALELLTSFKTCEFTDEQKHKLDELLLTYNALSVLYKIRNTYDEMLSANMFSELKNKKIKNSITEFYEQLDAMQHFIDQFRQDISLSYNIIKKHVVYDYDSNGQTIVSYEIAELCKSTDFRNAIYEVVNTRQNITHMVSLLSNNLESIKQMLDAEINES